MLLLGLEASLEEIDINCEHCEKFNLLLVAIEAILVLFLLHV